MMMTTRAGGQGLNLTGADTVILHDVDFNPQIDRQAEDRCHRLGQTRPVTIHRLVSFFTSSCLLCRQPRSGWCYGARDDLAVARDSLHCPLQIYQAVPACPASA